MNTKTRHLRFASLLAGCVALVAFAAPAGAFSALDLDELDLAAFDAITGDVHSTLISSYDFIPEAGTGDGQVTSIVYEGIGDAVGLYVYTFSIELYETDISSVGAVVGMLFHFGTFPDGMKAFFVNDGSGNKAPNLAVYDLASETAGFQILPSLTNGDTSLVMGLFSPNGPAEATAQLIDSGAAGGQTIVLSNGDLTAPIPEPSAALIFSLGLVVVAARYRARA